MVRIVGRSKVPALLPLVGYGKGCQHAVNVSGIQQFGAGCGGNSGKFHIHAQLVGQGLGNVNFHAGIFPGNRVLITKANYGIFNANPKNPTVYDCLYISIQPLICRGARRRCIGGGSGGFGRCGGGAGGQAHQGQCSKCTCKKFGPFFHFRFLLMEYLSQALWPEYSSASGFSPGIAGLWDFERFQRNAPGYPLR